MSAEQPLSDRIDAITNEVYALEQLVQSQKETILEMQEATLLKDELIALVAPDIEWKEQHLLSSSDVRMIKIVETYRKIYPKPPTQEG